MRRFIIDTDTASDDAVAIMAAAAARDVSILGVTTVAGNVSLAIKPCTRKYPVSGLSCKNSS